MNARQPALLAVLVLALLGSICAREAQAIDRWPPWQSYGEAEQAARDRAKRRVPRKSEIDALNARAEKLQGAGDSAKAIPVAQRALSLTMRRYGRNSEQTVAALTRLADLYIATERFKDAEPLLKRALAIREKDKRASPGEVAIALDNLAVLYQKQGRAEEARPLTQRAIAYRNKQLESDPTKTVAELRSAKEKPAEVAQKPKADAPAKTRSGAKDDDKVAAQEKQAAVADRKAAEANRKAAEAEAAEKKAAESGAAAQEAAKREAAQREAAQREEVARRLAQAQRQTAQQSERSARRFERRYARPPAMARKRAVQPPAAAGGRAAPDDDGRITERREGGSGRGFIGDLPEVDAAPPPAGGAGAPSSAARPPPVAAAPPPASAPRSAARAPASSPPAAAGEEAPGAPPVAADAPPPAAGETAESEVAAESAPPPEIAAESEEADADAAVAPPAPPAAAAAKDAEEKKWDVVPVFFGTNREEEPDPKRLKYNSDRAHQLALGRALVTVPKAHQVPQIERPWAIRIPYFDVTIYEQKEDPEKHFTMEEIKKLSKEDFLNLVRARLGGSQRFKDQALVFVHGYNTSFDNAVYRTAQVAYDLKFDGAPFLYSWPSGGGVASYTYDRESAEASKPYMREFFDMVVKETGAKKISIIAHSMGNQPVLDVLKDMKAATPEGVVISQVILAAPDVDADSFAYLARSIDGLAKGVTLYAAANDRALIVSRNFWGHSRAGDVPAGGPLVLPGVDTIDVTAISTDSFALNHSGYAQNNKLLTDIGELLLTGVRPPDERALKPQRVTTEKGPYWRYAEPATGSISAPAAPGP